MHRELGQPSWVETLLPENPGQNRRLERIAEVVRAVEAAEACHRLSQALTTAIQGRSGTVTLRLIPAADQVKIVDAERGVLDTIPGLNLFHHFAEAAEKSQPQTGEIALSGVGKFALAVHPSATETRLELTPLPAS